MHKHPFQANEEPIKESFIKKLLLRYF